MKKVTSVVSKMYSKVIYNQKLLNTLTVLVLTLIIVTSFKQTAFATGTGGGAGADPFTSIMNIVTGLLKKIGGVVAFVGAFMIIWGIKDHNPDTKMNGITTAAVGGGLFTLATLGSTFLN